MKTISLATIVACAAASNSTATCPNSESTCYDTPGCGYCIDSDYVRPCRCMLSCNNYCVLERQDGECRTGDMAAPFNPPSGGCTKQWTPGVYRAAGSVCLMASGNTDVRCYGTTRPPCTTLVIAIT
jgi:hypothetical protein